MGSVSLSPAKCAFVTDRSPDANFAGSAALYAGTNDLGYAYRILLEFDMGSLPGDARIQSARLSLCACEDDPPCRPGMFAPFALLEDWDESAVTWAAQPAHDPMPAGRPVEASAPGRHGWDITDLVGRWASGEACGGVLLMSAEDGRGGLVKFHAAGDCRLRHCAPSLDIRCRRGAGVCLESRRTACEFEERRAGDCPAHTRWQYTAPYSTFTYFAQNIGPDPAVVFLQVSPDAQTPLDEPPAVIVEPCGIAAVVPRRYGFWARLAFRSAGQGRPTRLKIWFQAQV